MEKDDKILAGEAHIANFVIGMTEEDYQRLVLLAYHIIQDVVIEEAEAHNDKEKE